MLLASFLFQSQPEQIRIEILNSRSERILLLVEIADSDSERARGLMFRDHLPENEGMLFVYEEENAHSFWMKNTRIPLEAIAFDANRTVVEILQMEPCVQDPCPSYPFQQKSQYVLEVNANFSRMHAVQAGNRAEWLQ